MNQDRARSAPKASRRALVSAAFPVAVLGLYGWLAVAPDLRLTASLPAVGLAVSAVLVLAVAAAERGAARWGPGTVLAVAAGCRLLFLFRVPELSDDIYRYLWDGLRTLAWVNPYGLAPSRVPSLSPELAALLARVNHPELVTIYPPAAQVLFALGAALGGVIGLKALLTALDLATCWLLLRLLRTLDQPSSRAVLYAWAPLPVLEVAGSGHVDAAGTFLLALALTALIGRAGRPRRDSAVLAGGAAFAGAALVKLFPAALLPGFLALAGRRSGRFLAGGGLAALALCLLFAPALGNALGTLTTYARHWEFAGFPFQVLRGGLGSGNGARWVLAAGFAAVWALVWAPALRHRAPALPILRAAYAVTLGLLLLSPTLHPWYGLHLAWLLPFAAEPGGLVLCAALPLAYVVLPEYALLGRWAEPPGMAALLWGATACALLLACLVQKRAFALGLGTGPSRRAGRRLHP